MSIGTVSNRGVGPGIRDTALQPQRTNTGFSKTMPIDFKY
jgi:hypothetical protein